jgi:GTPase
VGSVTQKLAHPLAGTYVGKGKLEEIKVRRDDVGYDVVMVDDDLTPASSATSSARSTSKSSIARD